MAGYVNAVRKAYSIVISRSLDVIKPTAKDVQNEKQI